MKALIFNSGLGSRMGSLTSQRPKCLVRLESGETILHRQLRILSLAGINDFVITTGPFEELVKAEARRFERRGCSFSFVHNPDYASTNYIWSMWLARNELLKDDFLVLHGDLVFDKAYVRALLDSSFCSLGSVNPALPLPEKDFKARVEKERVRRVSVTDFGEGCVAFQPFYKLSERSMGIWLDAVSRFVVKGTCDVYAENAANEVFDDMDVVAFSYEGHIVEEIDTPDDLSRVSRAILLNDYERQPVLEFRDDVLKSRDGKLTYSALSELISEAGMKKPLVITSERFASQLTMMFGGNLAKSPRFSGFSSNPTYEQVLAGLKLFREYGSDGLVSLGGGSAIDVAKSIAAFAEMEGDGVSECFADMEMRFSDIPHIAIPTTAGTGSESTHFAVCYVDGKKRSIAHPSLQPDVAVLAPELLVGLSTYQKKATLLDALCQAIESFWSVRSCEISRAYSRKAIPVIMQKTDMYLQGDAAAARSLAWAANDAGKAINITTTTAPHAMSYMLTSLYGIAHGHAVALCMPGCWELLLELADDELIKKLHELDVLVSGQNTPDYGAGLAAFEQLYAGFSIPPCDICAVDIDEIVSGVNLQRLDNNPIQLKKRQLKDIYGSLFQQNA